LRDIEKSRVENAKIASLFEERVFEDRQKRLSESIKKAKEERKEAQEAFNSLMNLIENPPPPESFSLEGRIKAEQALFDLEMRQAEARGLTLLDIERLYGRKLYDERVALVEKGITDKDVFDQLEKTIEAEKQRDLEKLRRDGAISSVDIEKWRRDTILQINADLISSTMGLLSAAFDKNKGFAIAETLISTYFAAQKAYQSVLASPQAIALGVGAEPLARRAAAAAVLQGLARVAAIRSTNINSSSPSSGGGASTASFGFTENKIEGPQTFRTPGFMPTSPMAGGMMTPKVEILADRKQLYYVVKRGEEEYRGIKA
jgi:hypothetical protein